MTGIGRELARGIVASERLRATLLAGTFLAIFLAHTATAVLLPDLSPPAIRAKYLPLGIFLAVMAAYELGARAWLGALLARGRDLPAAARFLNAAFEVSGPTLILVLIEDPGQRLLLLHGPAPFGYFIFIVLSTLGLDPRLCAATGAMAAAEYLWLSGRALGEIELDPLLASDALQFGKAMLILTCGLMAAFVAHQLRRRFVDALREAGERGRVVSLFGQHVSPAVVERLLARGARGESELRRVCVMFLDIRGFTAFAATRRPGEVVAYLDTLFAALVDAVNQHQGVIYKFLGDGFMAVFGAPVDDPEARRHAVAASRESLRRVEELVAAGRVPPTQIGIGLHAGEVVTGSVGPAQRKEYTVIGDTVNVAARIEGLNKEHGSHILASAEVCEGLDLDGAVPLGPVEIRGAAARVSLFVLA